MIAWDSDRKHADDELFHLFVEAVRDYAMFLLDADGRITSWNPGAERIKGYSREEIIGRHFSDFYTEEDRESNVPRDLLARAAQDGRVEAQGWRVRKDGSRFFADVVITALRDQSGNVRGFGKITRDVTERRKADQAFESNRQLAQALRAKDEFLAVLSHELRNPLAAAVMGIEVIKSLDGAAPAAQEALETVENQLQLITRLLEDLLDLNRISTGAIELRKRQTDLRRTVELAVRAVQRRADAAGHRISITSSIEPLWVNADPDRIEQVLLNLLENSIRYTAAGGTIAVAARREDGAAVVRVRDTGIGIEPEIMVRLFSPFVRGQRARERGGPGLGIGLAWVKRLVELHDGTITAFSEGRDKGAELVVRIPVAAGVEAGPAQPGEDRDGQASPGSRVLVVDDNRLAAELTAMLLRQHGHEVEVVHSGEEALTAFEAAAFNAVLLDIGLPGIDGYETARRIREMPGPQPVLIAITGYGQSGDRQMSLAAGFDHHLVKPVTAAQIEEAISASHGRRIA